jgi:hypothetical protein
MLFRVPLASVPLNIYNFVMIRSFFISCVLFAPTVDFITAGHATSLLLFFHIELKVLFCVGSS